MAPTGPGPRPHHRRRRRVRVRGHRGLQPHSHPSGRVRLRQPPLRELRRRAEDIAAYISEAEEWFGTIEVIGHQAVPIPGTTTTVELRSTETGGVFSGPMISVLDGRRPTSPDEIALTEGAAAHLDASLSDDVDVGRRSYEVVGLVENPADLDDEYALVLPDGQTPESITLLVDADREQADRFRPSVDAGSGVHRVVGGHRSDRRRRRSVRRCHRCDGPRVPRGRSELRDPRPPSHAPARPARRRRRHPPPPPEGHGRQRHRRRAHRRGRRHQRRPGRLAGLGVSLRAGGRPSHRPVERSAVAPGRRHGAAVATATFAAWWPARGVARMAITDAIAARPPVPRRIHRSIAAAARLLRLRRPRDRRRHRPQHRRDQPDLLHLRHHRDPPRRALGQRARTPGGSPARWPLPHRDPPGHTGPGTVRVPLGRGPLRDHPFPRTAIFVVVVAAANVPGADEGNLLADQLVVWTYSPNVFGGLQVPELSDADLTQREADVEAIADLPLALGSCRSTSPSTRRTPRWPAGSSCSTTPCSADPSTRTPSATPAGSSSPRLAPRLPEHRRRRTAAGHLAAHPPARRGLHHRQHHQPDLHPRPCARRRRRAHRRPQPLVGPPHPDHRGGPRGGRTRAMRAGWLLDLDEPLAADDLARARIWPPAPVSPSRYATRTVASPRSATSPPPPACCSPSRSWP